VNTTNAGTLITCTSCKRSPYRLRGEVSPFQAVMAKDFMPNDPDIDAPQAAMAIVCPYCSHSLMPAIVGLFR
jgi:hypothetical protein